MTSQQATRDPARLVLGALLPLLLCAGALPTRGEVVRFQNGIAPTPAYGGCVDTQISIYNSQESGVGAGKAPILRTYNNRRRILVRFDLTAIPDGQVVKKALLRPYCATPGAAGSGAAGSGLHIAHSG